MQVIVKFILTECNAMLGNAMSGNVMLCNSELMG